MTPQGRTFQKLGILPLLTLLIVAGDARGQPPDVDAVVSFYGSYWDATTSVTTIDQLHRWFSEDGRRSLQALSSSERDRLLARHRLCKLTKVAVDAYTSEAAELTVACTIDRDAAEAAQLPGLVESGPDASAFVQLVKTGETWLIERENWRGTGDQETSPEPRWFLDPTWVAWVPASNERPPGVGTAAERQQHFVEIQSNNYFSLWPRQNSDHYLSWARTRTQRTRSIFGLGLSTTIRGHMGASVPIQTPSVGFSGRYQILQHDRRVDSRSIVRMVGVALVHHSNGQEGCTFAVEERASDGKCAPRDGGSVKGSPINTVNGSFGTNYWAFFGGYSRRTVRPHYQTFGRSYSLSGEYRFHQNFPGGGLKEDLAAVFGRHEVAATIHVEPVWGYWLEGSTWPFVGGILRYLGTRVDRGQFSLRAWVRRGGERGYQGWSGEVMLPVGGGVWGVFGRYYSGDDYYNIRFAEKRKFVLLGAQWDYSRFLRLPK